MLAENESHIYPNMCAKFGCGPTVVSKRWGEGVQTDRQTKKTAALYSRSVSEEISVFHVCLLVTIRLIVVVVLAVARSKFQHSQYFLTRFTDMLFYYCYKCFFNILINHYIVCE